MAVTWKKLAYEEDVITKATLTAKGDLISASAASTPAVLAVGADGAVLVADAAEVTGLKWAAGPTPGAHKDTHDPADGSDPLDTAAAAEIAGVQAAGTGSAHSFARSDHAHAIQHGITDNHLLTVDDAAAASGDFARFTANGIEGLAKVDMLSALNVADGADVTANNPPQAHKDTHDPEDGTDPLDCAAASEIAGVQAAAEGTSHSLARADHVHAIQHGIADNHLVTVDDAAAADGDIAVFTANGVEGQTPAEVAATMKLDDIGEPDAAVGFAGQEATDFVFEKLAAPPVTPVVGKAYLDTDDNSLYVCTSAV